MKIGLGIICKPPRPGLSKTRLAGDIGATAAVRLADAFLRDVIATCGAAAASGDVALYGFYRPDDAEAELRAYFPAGTPLVPQLGEDLGEMMLNALTHMLADRAGAFVVGTDVPLLSTRVIRQAVSALARRRPSAVIGPSADGGYYLIGMTDPSLAPLLDPLPWSTPEVYRLTCERATAHGFDLTAVDQLGDVDDVASLARLKADLQRLPPDIAPATRAALLALDAP